MSNEGPEILTHEIHNDVTNANREDVEQGSFETRKELSTFASSFYASSQPISSPTSISSFICEDPDKSQEIFLQGKHVEGKQRDQYEVAKANRKDEEQGFVPTSVEDFLEMASCANPIVDAKPVKSGLTLTNRDDLAMASMILGMERTLFAALNNAWLLAIGGVGLMSVGHGDDRATYGGIVILSLGAVCAGVAYMMHILRVSQIRSFQSFQFSHTVVWASMIASLTIIVLGLELYFGILYPYLSREKTVTIASDTTEGLL